MLSVPEPVSDPIRSDNMLLDLTVFSQYTSVELGTPTIITANHL